MKINFLTIILIVLSTSGLFAQSNSMTNSLNNYSFDLYKQLESPDENLFFSPLSTYLALSIAYEGSKGETRKEFEKVLQLKKGTKNNDVINNIREMILWKDSSNYSKISNAIWIQDRFKIENTYKNIIQNKYSANIFCIDFSKKDSAALEINDWVSKSTNNLIRNIIEPVDIDDFTKFIITSAVSFVGKWADEFDIKLTKKADFYAVEKDTTSISFMNKTEYLNYYENNLLQFVSIQYKGNINSFCVILPSKKFGIAHVEMRLNQALLDTLFDNMAFSLVQISLPKFKIDKNYSLNEPLKNLGLLSAFNSDADFSGITTDGKLMINNINHNAFIKIDEEKTKAAAASVVSMVVSSIKGINRTPKIFNADHPFFFFILNNKTKEIIFMGKYVKPE